MLEKNFEWQVAGFSRKLNGEKPASLKFVLLGIDVNSFIIYY